MLYVLCGPSYSGKSTFAKRLISDWEIIGFSTIIINPDSIRGELFGDESVQSNGGLVFKTAYERLENALREGIEVIVFDATNLTIRARKPLLDMTEKYNIPAIAIVFDEVIGKEFTKRYASRERKVPVEVVQKQTQRFVLPTREEGFFHVMNKDAWSFREKLNTSQLAFLKLSKV